MNHGVSIHSFIDGHLDFFEHLAIVNCAAMNVGVHRFFWIGVSGSSGYCPSSGIAGSNDNSSFSFLRKFQTLSHTGCTRLHSHQQCTTKVPFSPQPCQHLVFVDLVTMTILTSMKWYLNVVLIWISLMANEHQSILSYVSGLAVCLCYRYCGCSLISINIFNPSI